MANILSMKDVASIPGVRVLYDSTLERTMFVHFNGCVYKFKECSEGLYYYDMKNGPEKCCKIIDKAQPSVEAKTEDVPKDKLSETVTPYSFLSTVDSNKQFYTSDEIKGAENARIQQEQLGWPSTTKFKRIIKNNLINNSKITIDDINRAEIIFGTPKPLLKGTMIRHVPITNKIEKVPLPIQIAERHKEIHLYIDFFFINGHAFLHTKSSKINFITAELVNSRAKGQIIKTLETVRAKYEARGFKIVAVHGDNEFDIEAVKTFLLPAIVHIYGKDEHVGVIERSVRTVKENCRTMTHNTPYKRVPKLMVMGLVENSMLCLNAFPSIGGISDFMSPSSIVEGKPKLDMNIKKIVYGTYAMVFIGTKNNMARRSVPAIALYASNLHGGHYFMSLYTGKRLHSYEWEELPIDNEVIARVEQLASEEDAPLMADGYPMFEWAPGVPIIDEVEEVINNNEEPDDEDNDNGEIVNNNANDIEESSLEDEEIIGEINEEDEEQHEEEQGVYISESDSDQEQAIMEEEIQEDSDGNLEVVFENENESESVTSAEDEENNDVEVDEVMNEDTEASIEESFVNNDNGRPRRANAGAGVERLEMSFGGKEYASVANQQHTMHKKGIQFTMKGVAENKEIKPLETQSYLRTAVNCVFAQVARYSQMPAKQGIKLFGERAIAAMFKEFEQLNKGAVPGKEKPVVGPQDASLLTEEEKRRALEAVNLIKEKRTGKIKGRTCANGSKQKRYLKRGETISSPTVSLEAMTGTMAIDIKEDRDVAIFDVPGAYLQAEMPKEKKLLLKLRGQFVDIMCEVNEEYKKYVIYEKGEKVLYLQILQAIYGCIESALLWYKLFATTLQGMGYEINPYDKCVANRFIEGKQSTITWYVDDNKISHVNKDVITRELEVITEHFGELDISRGDEHNLLGMHIVMNRKERRVEIDMQSHIEEAIKVIEDFGVKIDDTVATPANKSLFNVTEGCTELNDEMSEIFHSVTAKLLFIMKRARPDIETTVSFLMKRVSKSTDEDWKKLLRCLGFLKRTIEDKRYISADNVNTLFTWVDASHAVHEDMKGHTGGIMSMGGGAFIANLPPKS